MKIVVKQEGLFEKKKSVVVVAMHDLSAGEVLSVDMAPGKLESQVRTAEYRVRGMVWNLLLGCCLLYTSPSPRDRQKSRMPSSD